MIITKEQFEDFENAKKKKLGTFDESGLMSRKRWRLTSLDINTYIYIADHYEKLKKKFNK